MSCESSLFTEEIINEIETHKQKALNHLISHEFNDFHDHRKIIQGLRIATTTAYNHSFINTLEFEKILNCEQQFQKEASCIFFNMNSILQEKS